MGREQQLLYRLQQQQWLQWLQGFVFVGVRGASQSRNIRALQIPVLVLLICTIIYLALETTQVGCKLNKLGQGTRIIWKLNTHFQQTICLSPVPVKPLNNKHQSLLASTLQKTQKIYKFQSKTFLSVKVFLSVKFF